VPLHHNMCLYLHRMKRSPLLRYVILFSIILLSKASWSQNPVNWTTKELMEPAVLAKQLQSGKDLPVLISVGPGALIPGSISIGMIKEEGNLGKLKEQLAALPKEKPVVVYCGCCPFEHCPNVRPAVALLKEMKFTNYFLLNLPHNIKADWIDKNYPTVKPQN
jgi:thiosulfate/3-mercaptopyruvate sulfurtransferase